MSAIFVQNLTQIEDDMDFPVATPNDTDHHYNQTNAEYMNELLKLLRERHKQPLSTEDLTRNIIIIACYTLIIVVSLCGNLLVVKVIAFGKRKMLTTTNILIASLAFSDIVMTAFNIPFNVARLLLESWPFGSFLCVSVPFVQVTCVYVSTFTMTVIAFYRWWTLSHTTTSKSLTYLQLTIIITCVWLLAGLFSIPHSVFNKTIVIPTIKGLTRCHVVHPTVPFDLPLWLSIEAFATQYFVPLSVTLWLYIQIGIIVAKQGMLAGQLNDDRRRHQSDARKRRIVMLALVVTAFAICWLPLNMYHLLCDFGLTRRNFKVFILCHWFAMSSVCYNPFIYCYLNQNFKNAAKKCYQFMSCQLPAPGYTLNNMGATVAEEPTNTTNVNNIEMRDMTKEDVDSDDNDSDGDRESD
ncbi:unnamed protein product [Oppiella nova]|uniref:G-protein coupled receptors family 1 profile domain-containing protein n=1 Tax=Oppiella nova TaxID=334625 RepID=A0A7R9QAU6_9ACAR|nr:unnamed protein product [Oppiella nova]CAG2161942.1 unnamed protein product [Oppiella nova]